MARLRALAKNQTNDTAQAEAVGEAQQQEVSVGSGHVGTGSTGTFAKTRGAATAPVAHRKEMCPFGDTCPQCAKDY
jgi:hypothetical protein